jgi:uncharacterized protein (TIGR01777 family)
MKVAITGATGFIGRALCRELAQRGHQIVALTRDLQRARSVLPGAEAIEWSGSQAAVLPPVEAVVNLAGETVAGRWTPEKKQRIRDSRVEGTRRLVEAICRAEQEPAALVSASAVGYYGERGEEILTEKSAPGSGFLADVCREWEAEAARAETAGTRVTCLRLGIVLDRDGGALEQMLLPFRLGIGGPLGSGRQWMPWIHRADVIGLMLFALETASLSGALNVSAPEPVRNRDFGRTLGKVLHRPALLPAPGFALRLLLGEFASEVLGSRRVVPERAQALGYTFQYPQLEPALRAILEQKPHEDLSPGARSGRAPAD